MFVGAVVVLCLEIGRIPETSEWFNVYEMIPGFILVVWRLLWFLLSAEPENEVKETFEKQKEPIRKQNND